MDHFREAEELVELLIEKGLKVSTAESCTGGLIAASIVSVPGASSVLDEAHVTYANEAKMRYLNVGEETLRNRGAVSSECAREMALGLQKLSGCDLAICSTGLAGPGGATPLKPVGLVYIGIALKDQVHVFENHFKGSRDEVRNASVSKAFEEACRLLKTGV